MRILLMIGLLMLPALLPAQQAMPDFVDSDLQAAQLNETTMRNFEERAVQKLTDLGDFLQIISNQQMDAALRTETRKQAEALFHKDKCAIPAMQATFKSSFKKALTVSDWLALEMERGPKEATYRIANVAVSEQLVSAETAYTGTMTFELHVTLANGKTEVRQHTAGFTVERQEKKFGSRTVSIWEVFLCDLK